MKSYPLNRHLLLLVLASTIPFFIVLTVIVNGLVTYERNASEKRLQKAAMELALSVDQEIDATTRTLNALAASAELQNGQLKKFYEMSKSTLNTQPSWATILVHGPGPQTLLSPLRVFGEHLEPPAEPETIQQVFDTGKTAVGPLTDPPKGTKLFGQLGFAVRVPVFKNGKVNYVLSAIIGVEPLQRVVGRLFSVEDEWTRSLVDNHGRIAARSRGNENFIGTYATDEYVQLIQSKSQGISKIVTRDGVPIYTAFARAPVSQWTAAVGVTAENLEAQAQAMKSFVIAIGSLLILFFGGLALFYSKYIGRKIKSAAEAAAILTQGKIPQVEPSKVSEVEALRESLINAAQLLKLREEARAKHLRDARFAQLEAEKAAQAKSEFLANMSHELRTPLGIVLGFVDLIADNLIPPEDRQKSIATIKRNGQHLLRLIDDILDLSKADANRLMIDESRFSLVDLIKNAITELQMRAHEKGLKFNLNFVTEMPGMVVSDPVRLRQIIQNVVGNAIKFTEHGVINVSVAAQGPNIKITVQDSGIGISPEKQEKLFSMFTQADSAHTRKYGGTGLGLALSRRIALLLGGDISLQESTPGKGSTFQIKFAINTCENAVAPEKKNAGLSSSAGRLAKVKILLAEDSEDNVELISLFLNQAGAEIDVAGDGEAAIKKVNQHSYDLILMDIQMPRLDGYSATKKLRSDGYKLPIIALTAHALPEHRERALASGYSDYVTKPIQSDQLISVIEKNLSRATEL